MTGKKLSLALLLPLFIAGCASEDYADIKDFMDEVRARPAGEIDPIPIYPPYKSFSYGVMALRSPFERPVAIKEIARLVGPQTNVRPDDDRTREYLESFNIEALALVGNIQKGGAMYALVNDGQGSVHPVSKGNYLGRNHGKIVGLSETEINLVEIVSSGRDSWIERPRTISLQE